MQTEIIFIPNVKVYALEPYGSSLTINFPEGRKAIKNLESLGSPFTIITKREVDKNNPLANTPEFRELAEPIPIASTLEYYLSEAKVDICLSKKEDGTIQYLGVAYGKPAIIKIIRDLNDKEAEFKKNIVPCQFYLIKDKI